MKYYEILPTHTETPRNTTRKIANLYIEFNYHFLTLQKKSHYFWTGVYIIEEKTQKITGFHWIMSNEKGDLTNASQANISLVDIKCRIVPKKAVVYRKYLLR